MGVFRLISGGELVAISMLYTMCASDSQYGMGPIMTAQLDKNNAEATVHLITD